LLAGHHAGLGLFISLSNDHESHRCVSFHLIIEWEPAKSTGPASFFRKVFNLNSEVEPKVG
jgi:hypothetical protein